MLAPVQSTFADESNNKSNSIDETKKWDELKLRAFNLFMCSSLYDDVKSPKNPLFHPSYEDSGQMIKKYVAPNLAVSYGVPYSERSLEHLPLPGIETLPCNETVEKWRAMYEYKTVPYIEPPPTHPIFIWVDDIYQFVKKLFSELVALLVTLAILIGSFTYLYQTIKAIVKSKDWKFSHFLFMASFSSPLVIAPFYFAWTVLGSDGTFISYLIGCAIYIGSMVSIFSARKLLNP